MPYARKDTIEWLPGHFYHLYNRGAHQVTIFREADNYEFVLRRVKKYMQKYDVTVIAYCLLPNHYHFLIRQNADRPAGLLVQYTFNSYSKAYNKRYEHSGTLFEHRFQAIPVLENNYLLHLCRYIHANPVVHGIVPKIEDWPYSNYPEWVGLRAGTIIDRTFVAEHFENAHSYAEFVRDYLIHRQLPDGLAYLDDLDM